MGCTLTAKEEYVLDNVQYDGQMTSYIVDGEVLSYLRAFNKIPGEKKYLKKESEFMAYIENLLPKIFKNSNIDSGQGTLLDPILKHTLHNFKEE